MRPTYKKYPVAPPAIDKRNFRIMDFENRTAARNPVTPPKNIAVGALYPSSKLGLTRNTAIKQKRTKPKVQQQTNIFSKT